MTDDIETLSLSGQVVLLTVSHLSKRGETPAHTGEVIRTSGDLLDGVDLDALGSVSEAEVSRSLNRLEAAGLVAMADQDDSSPVGKGRPVYKLTVDVETVMTTLREDDTLAPVVEDVTE
jgi:DNA-binding transcriptional ArsR family regulator